MSKTEIMQPAHQEMRCGNILGDNIKWIYFFAKRPLKLRELEGLFIGGTKIQNSEDFWKYKNLQFALCLVSKAKLNYRTKPSPPVWFIWQ